MGFLEVMKKIPTTFEQLFVHQDQRLDGDAVIACLSVPHNLSPEQSVAVEMLKRFIMEASDSGQFSQ